MITGAIAVVFLIAMYCAGSNGEWGSVAIGAVIVLVLLAVGAESRGQDRAYNNFIHYWDTGEHPEDRRKQTVRSNSDQRPGRVTKCEREEAARRRVAYLEKLRNGKTSRGSSSGGDGYGRAVVCHYCGRMLHVNGEYVMSSAGRMLMYYCPRCGMHNMTKIGA